MNPYLNCIIGHLYHRVTTTSDGSTLRYTPGGEDIPESPNPRGGQVTKVFNFLKARMPLSNILLTVGEDYHRCAEAMGIHTGGKLLLSWNNEVGSLYERTKIHTHICVVSEQNSL
ncbi:hypothetical protein CEXT_58041 [Caerostris extrusa]|uniref:Uncharacterized protein n=1 Tax=Caerostris extrusa TaxID=172846 RepID=A0AAV4QCV8_CAEEX|nr:hypothetical protein CEXT_58041 [Caerostris extrusa]